MNRDLVELLVQLVVTIVVAVLAALLDVPLLGVDLAWWVCLLVGVVVGFGGVLILRVHDDW